MAPAELQAAILEFWPDTEWENAASVAFYESGFSAFAIADTRDSQHPCGTVVAYRDGLPVTAELSVGYYQINACNFPEWEWQRFYNARHNAGTAHMLWEQAGGWSPWHFTAVKLGLE